MEKHRLLKKIENVRCVGDIMHNETIDLLLNDIDYNSEYTKIILKIINNIFNKFETEHWSFRIITKTECKRFNAIMRSKTIKTFKKRYLSLISMLNGKMYGWITKLHILEELKSELKTIENMT